MEKILFLTSILGFILFIPGVFALAPPDEIERIHLEGDLIVLGVIQDIQENTDEPSFFTLKISQVIKGIKKIQVGQIIHIQCDQTGFSPSDTSLKAHQQGIRPVQAQKEDHVIAYLNHIHDHVYKPVLKGLSIIATPSR